MADFCDRVFTLIVIALLAMLMIRAIYGPKEK